MSKPSKGPWKVLGHDMDGVWSDDGVFISRMTGGRTEDESKANARLISAAPDLLDALLWAMCNLQEVGGDDNEQYAAAWRAIVKATGGVTE